MNKIFQKGQSLFEVVLALSIVTLVLVALVTLSTTSVRNTTQSSDRSGATSASQELIEWLREQRDNDWDIFVAETSGGTYCFSDLSWPAAPGGCGTLTMDGVHRREVDFLHTGAPTTTVKATVNITWDEGSGTSEVKTITEFTDWTAQ